ncbi:helix-turn-helix domain containing protein [Pokkaliibacter sp. MBI-7]|uniref:TetR/AcrR family transcriptional regulator n=1 Tax=Pokkaliibacter sp. MBI-7 TaxID=3040600 RepID=UPI00244BC9BA|nr:helix-turn-helix domain containing protein [Pokkaliibacter sp. MBI-7]MDH2431775.1 helix-turn-helix domain containing protein [Pokkaliibacter sp. MBI-7]
MPYAPEHKQQSRERIVRAAAELFSTKGFDAVSIDQVMEAAGLTRGAFYAHFRSKQELYRESIIAASRHSGVANVLKNLSDPAQTARQVINSYLSNEHLALQFFPCPMAFLSTDIANRDKGVRDAYTRVFHGLNNVIEAGLEPVEERLSGNSQHRQQRALAITALMVGGMAIARALTDEDSKAALLTACMDTALGLQEGDLGSLLTSLREEAMDA